MDEPTQLVVFLAPLTVDKLINLQCRPWITLVTRKSMNIPIVHGANSLFFHGHGLNSYFDIIRGSFPKFGKHVFLPSPVEPPSSRKLGRRRRPRRCSGLHGRCPCRCSRLCTGPRGAAAGEPWRNCLQYLDIDRNSSYIVCMGYFTIYLFNSIHIYSLWYSNMASWKIPYTEWRFLARKITYVYGPFSSTPCWMKPEGTHYEAGRH